MGVCVFVASGLNFDVDGYLATSPFRPTNVFHKGHVPPKDNPQQQPRPDSGFVVLISQSAAPIQEAFDFLSTHEKELNRLKSVGVDNMLLDLGSEVGDKIQHSEYIPPDLIALLARFRMGLVLSTVQIPRG